MSAGRVRKIAVLKHRLKTWQGQARRLALLILWAVWWGGLTFYAVVVVPIGTEVLGSVEQGFITQQVIRWHNGLTVVFLLLMLFEAYWRQSRVLWAIVATLCFAAVGLILWHARLTGMMDFKHLSVPPGFYAEHAIYLWITAAEWALGMIAPIWLFSDDSKAKSQSA